MKYPGGKNGGGAYQRIINQIPPHGRYVEAFCGSAPVLRHKLPARESWAIDLDPGALAAIGDRVPDGTKLVADNAIWWIRDRRARQWWRPDDFLYCDPPYLLSTRRSGPMYEYELTEEDHRSLLDALRRLPCMVALSGYRSSLYRCELREWRTISWESMTRGGRMATEYLWMNYAEPEELHDYRFLGDTFREREKFGRRRKRWVAKLRRMKPIERQALLAAWSDFRSPGGIAETGDCRGNRQKRR